MTFLIIFNHHTVSLIDNLSHVLFFKNAAFFYGSDITHILSNPDGKCQPQIESLITIPAQSTYTKRLKYNSL